MGGAGGVGALAPPVPLTLPAASPHPPLSWPRPLPGALGPRARVIQDASPQMSLGTTRSPCPKLTLASDPLLLILLSEGMAPLSACHWDRETQDSVPDAPLLPPPTLGACLLNLSSICAFLSLPVAPALVRAAPACVWLPPPQFSRFLTPVSPSLLPQCSEPAVTPQCLREKAQLLGVAHGALHGLAPAGLTSLTDTPSFQNSVLQLYCLTSALSPQLSLLPSALFHCLPNTSSSRKPPWTPRRG